MNIIILTILFIISDLVFYFKGKRIGYENGYKDGVTETL